MPIHLCLLEWLKTKTLLGLLKAHTQIFFIHPNFQMQIYAIYLIDPDKQHSEHQQQL